MKKLLIALGLILSTNAYSSEAMIEDLDIDSDEVLVKEACLNGLAFALVVTGRGYNGVRGVSLEQVYVPSKYNKPSQPKQCGTKPQENLK